MMNRKPNLFSIATKELSQDGFLTWLIQWADDSNLSFNKELCLIAKDFIKHLILQQYAVSELKINKVIAGRQWHNIDIWAEINEEYFIIIEDKTNTVAHSGQLERYKEIACKEHAEKNYKFVLIYLKTGNESLSKLKQIKEYSIIGRKNLLQVFNQRQISNEIFNDFKDYITTIEEETNSYHKFENILSSPKATEGFFLKLQELLEEQSSDWRYVATPSGGFLGFWYHWLGNGVYSLHIQIENTLKNDIKLMIKIEDCANLSLEMVYKILSELQISANKEGLVLSKPNKYKIGTTTTLAIVNDAFKKNNDGTFDIDLFLQTLKKLEQIIDSIKQ